MDVNPSDVISSFSLLVSIGAILFAKNSTSTANKIAQENLKLQNGMAESQITQSIENAKSKINEISMTMVPFVSKEKSQTITKEEENALALYRKNLNAAVQTLINTYDSACSKYMDGKVDKDRFKKTYKNEIRKLVENDEFEGYFNPLTSSYKPILNAYSEWEHLE